METGMVVVIAIVALVIGIAVGYLICKLTADDSSSLRNELESLQERFKGYQEEVASHFTETANLSLKLSQAYKDIQNHLSQAAEGLIADEELRARLLADLADTPKALTYAADEKEDFVAPNALAIDDEAIIEDEKQAEVQQREIANHIADKSEAISAVADAEEAEQQARVNLEKAIDDVTVTEEDTAEETVKSNQVPYEINMAEENQDDPEAPKDYAPKIPGETGTLDEEFNVKHK